MILRDNVETFPLQDPQLHSVPWYGHVVSLFYGLPGLLATAFWIWMLVECLRKDPDRYYWMWFMVIVPPIAPVVYFFARWLPSRSVSGRKVSGRAGKWTRRKELRRLELAAKQIGNAHQFIQWGEALLDVGDTETAGRAFDQALERESENIQALWGAAQVDMKRESWESAVARLQAVLGQDPQYKFGDVSLVLGKALQLQGQADAARDHLSEHVRRWRHPEGVFRLATLEAKAGNIDAARTHLDALITDVESSPTGIARRHRSWQRKARRLLRALASQ